LAKNSILVTDKLKGLQFWLMNNLYNLFPVIYHFVFSYVENFVRGTKTIYGFQLKQQ